MVALAAGIWLGQTWCEKCGRIQRNKKSLVIVVEFADDEYTTGCATCNHHYARYILV